MKADKPLAKSLHTVSVLVAIALDERSRFNTAPPSYCVGMALGVLDLAGKPDPHNLRAQAINIVTRKIGA